MTEAQVYRLALETAQVIAPLYGLPTVQLARFATALARVETGGTYNPLAKNRNSSARGLMQVLICTQRWMEQKLKLPFAPASVALPSSCKQYAAQNPAKVPPERDRMYDAAYNMKIGMTYAAYQLKRYGLDERRAAHAYNQGNYSTSKAGATYANNVLSGKARIDFATYEKSMQDVVAAADTPRHYEFR